MTGLRWDDVQITPQGAGVGCLDYLIADLKTLQAALYRDGKYPARLAEAIERNLAQLLDDLRPEIKRARDEHLRYMEAPKIGEPG